jgi:hypothetical protein
MGKLYAEAFLPQQAGKRHTHGIHPFKLASDTDCRDGGRPGGGHDGVRIRG